MDRLAFVFSGQADLEPGIRELIEDSPEAMHVIAACDRIRPDTSVQIFFGNESEFRQPSIAQPCLYAMELAAAAALREHGITASAAAGYSIGEVSAYAYAGIISLEDGMRIAMKRGQLMEQEGKKYDTFTAGILRLSESEVRSVCRNIPGIFAAAFHCPGQAVATGIASVKTDLIRAVQESGGRTISLKDRNGYHSPFMKKAAEQMTVELDSIAFKSPEIPLYANETAHVVTGNYQGMLARQMYHPILWEQQINNMSKDGYTEFVEIGPGRALTGMIRKIRNGAKAYALCDFPGKL